MSLNERDAVWWVELYEFNVQLIEGTGMNFIEAHKFFVRKSQFYLNGNWACYKPFTFKQVIYYPIAYCKFMYLTFMETRG